MLRFFFLIYYALIIIIYYYFGGEAFPDYLSYIRISNGDFGEDFRKNYFFEWISINWLLEMPSLLGSSKLTVDILAVGAQLAYFYWVIRTTNMASLAAKFWITSFSGALLLTTTLRGTYAYLAAFILIEKRQSLKKVLLIVVIGLAFHDSFFVVVVCYLLSLLFSRFLTTYKLVFLNSLSLLIVIFGQQLMSNIPQLLSVFDFGVRDVYLNQVEAVSDIKIAYALFIGLSIFFVLYGKNKLASLEETYLVILYTAASITFSISHISGIRMLIYVSGTSLLLLAHHKYWGKIMRHPFILLFIPPIFLFISFYDLFKNAAL